MPLQNQTTMNIYIWIGIGLLLAFIVWFFFRSRKLLSSMNAAPSEKLVQLNDKNFKNQISKGVVLVDFWAEWCQPCKILGPVISEIADEMSDKAKIAKLDVERNQRAAQEMGIRNIPTVILFKNGKVQEKIIGVKPKRTYVKAIEAALQR